MSIVVLGLALAGCGGDGSDDSGETASDPDSQPSTSEAADDGASGELDPELCAVLREQAQGALAASADPEPLFDVRDAVPNAVTSGRVVLKVEGSGGGSVLAAFPQQVQDDQDALSDGVNELLPLLDVAKASNQLPDASLSAFHAEYDPVAQRIITFVDENCP